MRIKKKDDIRELCIGSTCFRFINIIILTAIICLSWPLVKHSLSHDSLHVQGSTVHLTYFGRKYKIKLDYSCNKKTAFSACTSSLALVFPVSLHVFTDSR